jgi:hypothetical protein
MDNEELKLKIQAEVHRQYQAQQAAAPAPAPATPQPPAPATPQPPAPELPPQFQALLASAQAIQQAPLLAGHSLVPRPTLPAGTVAAIDFVRAQQAAAPAAPKPPTVQEVYFQAAVAHREQVAKQPQPLVPGFTRSFMAKPQRPQV